MRPPHRGAGSGIGRSSAINRQIPFLEHLPWNGDIGRLKASSRPWLMTLASILISFSLGVVSGSAVERCRCRLRIDLAKM